MHGPRGTVSINLLGNLVDGVKKFFKARRAPESCPIRPRNSFAPGTLVALADGSSKRIEDVDVGDVVLATDPQAGITVGTAVVATITGDGVKHLVRITVDTGETRESVVATAGHPFWVPESGKWLGATDLRPGQWLQTSTGTLVRVTAVERWTQIARVHNLTIADLHTYYVIAGGTAVLVHNDNPFPDRDMPRNQHGQPVPDVDAPHSQLGRNNRGKPSEYNVAHEFDENGRLVRQVHWSDHSDPSVHTNPHQHV